MRENSNDHYMAVLGALGAMIENNKSDLALAKYDICRLQEKLMAAEKEIADLKAKNAKINKPEPVENSDYPFE